MSKHIVSISIVTYNSEEFVGNLLDSLHANLKETDPQIFVVDNASTDDTLRIVRESSCNVNVIVNERNVGFGAGHNIVISQVDSKYHFCINPDVVIDSDIISEMTKYIDENEDIAIVMPKVLNSDGTVQVLPKRDPKLISLISRRVNIKSLRKYRDEYEMRELGDERVYDIEFASGCFMCIRADLLKRVGGFDERYFLYFEDADLSRRIRKFARIQYNPRFAVYHHWDRAGARNMKYFIVQIVSMMKYLMKWKNEKI